MHPICLPDLSVCLAYPRLSPLYLAMYLLALVVCLSIQPSVYFLSDHIYLI